MRKSVKQTLLDIRRTTSVTTKAIAECARLPIADVFVVETGGFTSKENAQKVVIAFHQRESACRLCLTTLKSTIGQVMYKQTLTKGYYE